jgi:hypothetical protein
MGSMSLSSQTLSVNPYQSRVVFQIVKDLNRLVIYFQPSFYTYYKQGDQQAVFPGSVI